MGIKYRKVFDFTWKSNRSWSYTRTLLVFSFVFKVIKILQSPIFVAMSVLKSPYRKKIKIAYTRLYTFIYRYVCVYKFGELWKIYTKICHSFMKYLLHGYPFAGTEVHASREQKKQWTLFSWSLDSRQLERETWIRFTNACKIRIWKHVGKGSFLGSFQDSMISRILGKARVTAMRREGRWSQGR